MSKGRDKTIHVLLFESEHGEEIADLRKNLPLRHSRANLLYFKVGDDALRAILAALEDSARPR